MEIEWTLPYAIPGDRTQADIVCSIPEADAVKASGGAKDDYSKDPLKIYQSSMMTKGWGKGNCFYLGAATAQQNHHRFQCTNMGALAKSAKMSLAFQFAITNEGKKFTTGTADTAGKGYVVQYAKALSCNLKINTYK